VPTASPAPARNPRVAWRDDCAVVAWESQNSGQTVEDATVYVVAARLFKVGEAGGPVTPISIGRPVVAAGKVNLAWAGGQGPFTVQKKAKLTDADWVDVLTTPDRAASVNLEGDQGFLRVVDRVNATVTLSGAAEHPAVATAGTGSGTLILDGNKLTVDITYSGLTGTVSASHIHGPATTAQDTGVLKALTPALGATGATAGTLKGEVTLTSAAAAHLVNGLTYVNIHTSFAGGGEIRGQVVPQP